MSILFSISLHYWSYWITFLHFFCCSDSNLRACKFCTAPLCDFSQFKCQDISVHSCYIWGNVKASFTSVLHGNDCVWCWRIQTVIVKSRESRIYEAADRIVLSKPSRFPTTAYIHLNILKLSFLDCYCFVSIIRYLHLTTVFYCWICFVFYRSTPQPKIVILITVTIIYIN